MLQGYPLQQDIFNTPTDGKHFPGFIDDCLPDDWGRKIVARKLKRRFIDQITLMKNMAAWPSLLQRVGIDDERLLGLPNR
jgi:hypothetical protein